MKEISKGIDNEKRMKRKQSKSCNIIDDRMKQ